MPSVLSSILHPSSFILFLLALAALLFLINLGGYDLWPPDEPRYAQVAREMMQRGDYLVPRLNDTPYLEKPPLLFWAIAAASWPHGDVTERSTRMPSVVAGLLTVLLTYLLARRLYGPRIAFWAALLLITCHRFWWQTRFGQIDMLLTACLTLGLYVFWRWYEDRRTRWLVLFYLAAAAALYAKGEGTIVFPVLFLFAFYWNARDDRWETRWILGFAAACALFALWVVAARTAAAPEAGATAEKLVLTNLVRQTVGRFLLGVSHAKPPWYYLKTLPLDWLPWTLFLPWTLAWIWKHREEGPELRLLLCWTVPAFIFFSISIGKRAIYLLPLFPALSILIARSVLELVDSDHVRWRRGIALVWALGLVALGIAPLGMLAGGYAEVWEPSFLIITFVGCGFGLYMLAQTRLGDMRKLHVAMAGQAAVIAVLAPVLVFPTVNSFKSARDFCAPVRELVENGAEFDVYSVGFLRGEYVFYSRHFLKTLVFETPEGKQRGHGEDHERRRALQPLRRHMTEALDAVPIQSLERVSDSECHALAHAFEKTLQEEDLAPALRMDIETSLRAAGNSFRSVLDSSTPSFFIVQAGDWRWLLARHPDARRARVAGNQGVGSRHVLLIANPAAEALLKSKP